jgi:hypothetical protein
VGPRGGRGQWGEVAQTTYAHMNKLTNNKKGKKKEKET